MLVANTKAILDFIQAHPDSQSSLLSWLAEAQRQVWATPNQMRQSFPSASIVPPWTVFNIAGNKYRMIAEVDYTKSGVFVAAILTHQDYDKGKWK